LSDEIRAFVENFIRPRVQADGGEVVFAGLDGNVIKLTLMGECAVCTSSCGVREWIAAQLRGRFGEYLRLTFESKKRYFQDI